MKRIVILITPLLLLLGFTMFLGNEYAEIKYEFNRLVSEKELVQSEQRLMRTENEAISWQREELVKKRQQEKDQHAQAIEMARFQTYMEHVDRKGERVAGYMAWEKADDIAENLYEDSDGKFKREWGRFLALEAMDKEMDPLLIYELLRVETGGTFDPRTVGPQTDYGKAYGMAQFMKNTSPWIADMAGLPYEDELLFDPLYSIQLAVTYLDFLYKQYGDWDHALTAYHRGMGGLKSYKEQNGHAKSWYAVEIQEKAEQRQG